MIPFTHMTAGGLALELAVLVEKKRKTVPRQWENFQCYLKVAQLQDLSRLVLWKTLDEHDKPFEKSHLELLKVLKEEKIEGGNCSG